MQLRIHFSIALKKNGSESKAGRHIQPPPKSISTVLVKAFLIVFMRSINSAQILDSAAVRRGDCVCHLQVTFAPKWRMTASSAESDARRGGDQVQCENSFFKLWVKK
jgi:hypothetical protein